MSSKKLITLLAAVTLAVGACGESSSPVSIETSTAAPGLTATDEPTEERLAAIDQAVAEWRTADTIEAAHRAAEVAANLVVGPNGPGYGDRNGDGSVGGEATEGLLPGLDGTPPGPAVGLASNDCVASDVLGGAWTDPAARWAEMLEAIDDWRPGRNTMPSLASHPMRIVGWATFTLGSDALDDAHEYAGHAKLHVDISVAALDC